MTTKVDLHELIDALPGWVLPEVEQFLLELKADTAVPHVPPDEAPVAEPEEDELQAIAEGRAAIARGDVISDEDLARALGL